VVKFYHCKLRIIIPSEAFFFIDLGGGNNLFRVDWLTRLVLIFTSDDFAKSPSAALHFIATTKVTPVK
jgi:hypothetical protein